MDSIVVLMQQARKRGSIDALYAKAKTMMFMETDRAHVFREAIMCCREGGTVSVPGAYVGVADKIPLAPFMNKGLTLKTGQTHVQRYLEPSLQKIETGVIDASFTHHAHSAAGAGTRDVQDIPR